MVVSHCLPVEHIRACQLHQKWSYVSSKCYLAGLSFMQGSHSSSRSVDASKGRPRKEKVNERGFEILRTDVTDFCV